MFTERRSTCAVTQARSPFPADARTIRQRTWSRPLCARPRRKSGSSGDVEVVGALPPVGTFVTGYKVHPFVGVIPEGLSFKPSPSEVAAILLFRLDELRAGFAMRRLVRRGIPIRTPTYVVGEHLIWGATGRILGELLERLGL